MNPFALAFARASWFNNTGYAARPATGFALFSSLPEDATILSAASPDLLATWSSNGHSPERLRENLSDPIPPETVVVFRAAGAMDHILPPIRGTNAPLPRGWVFLAVKTQVPKNTEILLHDPWAPGGWFRGTLPQVMEVKKYSPKCFAVRKAKL